MPQRKPPVTLFDIALPVTALCIRDQCDAILRNYGDVTQSAFQDRIESFNEHLRKEVPIRVLDCIRQHQNLAVFIYHQVKTLTVEGKTLRNSPIHQHLTHNVLPSLGRSVTFLDLSQVEGTLDLFRAISTNCPQLEIIVIDTLIGGPFGETVGMWLLTLTTCKKLKVIRNTTFDWGFRWFGSFNFQTSFTFRILQELPELREFKCDVISILARKEILVDVYNITQLRSHEDSDSVSAENIQWLNIHCPFIDQVELVSINDTILQALTLTDWKIKSVTFLGISHKFTDTMKLFFKNKGMIIENVLLYCDDPQESLCYDDVVWISQCCPVLKRLMFDEEWYNGEDSTPLRTRTTCSFPYLEYLSIDVHSLMFVSQYSIFQVIFDALTNLRELRCTVRESAMLPFLNIIAGLRNPFDNLIKVTIDVLSLTPDKSSTFLHRFIPIAMGWKHIRQIEVVCSVVDLLPEVVQYLEETESTIKEQNLDVTLNVGWLFR